MGGMDVTVLVMDNRVWFESGTLAQYLREVQRQAKEQATSAEACDDMTMAVAAGAIEDAMGQVSDGIVLTAMEASMTIADRRKSR